MKKLLFAITVMCMLAACFGSTIAETSDSITSTDSTVVDSITDSIPSDTISI